jgi:hypothetical protein
VEGLGAGQRYQPDRRRCDGSAIAPLFEGPLGAGELATTRALLLRLAGEPGLVFGAG